MYLRLLTVSPLLRAILSLLEVILTRLFVSTITSVSTLNSLQCRLLLLLSRSIVTVRASVSNNRTVSTICVSFHRADSDSSSFGFLQALLTRDWNSKIA